MMLKKPIVSSLLLCALTWMSGPDAFAGENWVGTWKLDAAKSQLASGAVTRAQTLKFEATPAGIKLTSEGTDPEGKPMQGQYTSKFDGKDVAWSGNPSADTACPKRIDDNTYENVWKKGDKPVMTTRVVVSNDGKTLTITQTPTDAQGAAAASVAVYHRQ
jgi:hypothetical protein